MNGSIKSKDSQETARDSARGFTLIELSIVLVIIGLITGGVLAGRDLIRASELQSVITDFQKFETAVNTFRGKYNCLPGDCANATLFFGQTAQACVAGTGPNGVDINPGTCNGQGNGYMAYYSFYLPWQHLALAGLIPGHYTGTGSSDATGCGGNCVSILSGPLQNSPNSRISGGGYTMWSESYFDDSTSYNAVPGTDVILFGSLRPHWYTYYPVLTSVEARQVDAKLDDGLPVSGKIRATKGEWNGSSCTTSNDDVTAQYNTASVGVQCMLVYRFGNGGPL
jgi:prepilin-type N-terminal cleavage/methylation domain-containing protein